jgi:hypothetical protein
MSECNVQLESREEPHYASGLAWDSLLLHSSDVDAYASGLHTSFVDDTSLWTGSGGLISDVNSTGLRASDVSKFPADSEFELKMRNERSY